MLAAVGRELSLVAHRILSRQSGGDELQATALISELWLKLSQPTAHTFADRHHFMKLAVRTMRNIVVDHTRRMRADKRAPPGHSWTSMVWPTRLRTAAAWISWTSTTPSRSSGGRMPMGCA